MFQTIGVCGTGNMGRAIVKGLVAAHAIAADHIYLYNIHKEKAEALAKETGAVVVDTPEELARQSQGLIMAVKPNIMESALEAVRESLPADSVLISIAAGISLEKLAFYTGPETKIVRVMPNTPAMVGEGMASVSPNVNVTEAETADVVAIFSSFGKAVVTDEKLIDAVCGLSGSGPASCLYVHRSPWPTAPSAKGCPRQMAYTFAAPDRIGSSQDGLGNRPPSRCPER